jgi:hypothetical protein
MKPHLNSALRAEILYFTTQGIMFAVQESKTAKREMELARLSTGAEISAEDAHNARDSQFSFKDILENRCVLPEVVDVFCCLINNR